MRVVVGLFVAEKWWQDWMEVLFRDDNFYSRQQSRILPITPLSLPIMSDWRTGEGWSAGERLSKTLTGEELSVTPRLIAQKRL